MQTLEEMQNDAKLSFEHYEEREHLFDTVEELEADFEIWVENKFNQMRE